MHDARDEARRHMRAPRKNEKMMSTTVLNHMHHSIFELYRDTVHEPNETKNIA